VSNANQLIPLQLGIMGSKISSNYSKPPSKFLKSTRAQAKPIQFISSKQSSQLFEQEILENRMQKISLGINKGPNTLELKGKGLNKQLNNDTLIKNPIIMTRNLPSMAQI